MTGALKTLDSPVVAQDVRISAASVKLSEVDSGGDLVGQHPIPVGEFIWTLVSQPGPNVQLTQTSTLQARLRPNVPGNYKVELTVCPGGCSIQTITGPTKPVSEKKLTLTIQTDNADFDIKSANTPVATQQAINEFNWVRDKQYGVSGWDPVGHRIGIWPAENGGPYPIYDIVNNYFPYSWYKQVTCGTLRGFDFYDGGGDEADWDLYITPDSAFGFRIQYHAGDGSTSCNGSPTNCLEAEITPDEDLYQNPYFDHEPKVVGNPPYQYVTYVNESQFTGKKVCVYGPWVQDAKHGDKPEIHPSELIWNKTTMNPQTSQGVDAVYTLLLLQEDSNRFELRDNFDFDGDEVPSWWRPWAKHPRTGEFRIAFEVDLTKIIISPRTFQITDDTAYSLLVRSYTTTEENSLEADDLKDHVLKYDGRAVIKVSEVNADVKHLVNFVDLTRDTNNKKLRGYVSIKSRVSLLNNGDEGYLIMAVQSLAPVHFAPIPVTPITSKAIAAQAAVVAPAPPVRTVGNVAWQPDSLQSVVFGGKAQPGIDLEIAIGLSASATATQAQIASAAFVNGSQSRTIAIEDIRRTGNSLALTLMSIPVFQAGFLELTFQDGSKQRVSKPEVGLSSDVGNQEAKMKSPAPGGLTVLAHALGASAVPNSAAPTVYVRQWEMDFVSAYVSKKFGNLSPEDESPLGEAVNEVLSSDDAQDVAALFGSQKPLTASWTFDAQNLTTGEKPNVTVVDVAKGQSPPADAHGAVVVELHPLAQAAQTLRVTFPDNQDLLELTANAKTVDAFGNSSQLEHRIWNLVLENENGSQLRKAALTAATELVGASASDLLDLTDPAKLLADDGYMPLRVKNPRVAAAQAMGSLIFQLALDRHITPGELETLMEAATVFKNASSALSPNTP